MIAEEMLNNPFESMVINGNVAQSMTFNVYGNGNQPIDKIYFSVEMLTSPEIIIHLAPGRIKPVTRGRREVWELHQERPWAASEQALYCNT